MQGYHAWNTQASSRTAKTIVVVIVETVGLMIPKALICVWSRKILSSKARVRPLVDVSGTKAGTLAVPPPVLQSLRLLTCSLG